VDESTGKKVCQNLSEAGIDAKYVGDVMRGSPDKEVLKHAEKEGRILVTNDKDFGELVFRLGKSSSGVIFLRLNRDIPSVRTRCLLSIIENLGEKLSRKFVVLTEEKYRVRKIK